MSKKRPPVRVLGAITEYPWAMLPAAFDLMLEIVGRRFTAEILSPEEKEARIEAARRTPGPATAPGSIAVLNLYGVMAQRVGAFADVSQEGTACEAFAATFRAAMSDPNVTAIVLNVDSPGGSVFGVEELGDVIWSAKGTKPVIAVANSMAASAAYWVATQADELVVTPGGEVGSVGVLARHEDVSAAAEAQGVRVTFVTAPEGGHKAEGNPFEPLSDDARSHLQTRVNDYYGKFVSAVARGRKVSMKRVREDFGQGRMYGAAQAVAAGMADRVDTLQGVINGLMSKGRPPGRLRGEAEGQPTLQAGPMCAPNLREGGSEMACSSCKHFSKPSDAAGGVCSRHDFVAEDAWVCDDWESPAAAEEDGGMDMGAAQQARARARLALAGAGRQA